MRLTSKSAEAREAFKNAYQAYLNKAVAFKNPPQIGEHWPRDGYYLPSVEVFMQAFDSRASTATVTSLLELTQPQQTSKSN